jgi:uncharacterized membrane protein YeaQ/YmgE (transglycosylase-associated protein family)
MNFIHQKQNCRRSRERGTMWPNAFSSPWTNGDDVSADPLLTFALRPVIGGLAGLLLYRFVISRADISLDVLLGAAGGLVGGMIASFPELQAFGSYRELFGATLGGTFLVLSWEDLRHRR